MQKFPVKEISHQKPKSNLLRLRGTRIQLQRCGCAHPIGGSGAVDTPPVGIDMKLPTNSQYDASSTTSGGSIGKASRLQGYTVRVLQAIPSPPELTFDIFFPGGRLTKNGNAGVEGNEQVYFHRQRACTYLIACKLPAKLLSPLFFKKGETRCSLNSTSYATCATRCTVVRAFTKLHF